MKKKKSFFRRAEIFLRATRRLLNIRHSSDPEGTIASISQNIAVKGYNIWILVCSALLASIGLDTNSTAVIIGAMLISPLMSPILGVGLGLGTNDQAMFFKSIRNLGVATFASLLASFLYFELTPFGDPNSEILGRTYPTLLDVLIAFFGGVAGIVSGSRIEKTNAIPGVAIATALMPPLCTAGYGLAKLQIGIFLGAFYLFTINAVFISISTYLIVKYLRFPLHKEPDERTRRAVNRAMLISLLVVTAPSVYFLFSLWYRVSTVQKIDYLVSEVSEVLIQDNKHEILNVEKPKTANEIKTKKMIKMYVSGDVINDSIRNYYTLRFRELGDFDFSISLINNVSPETMDELNASDKALRDNVLQQQSLIEELQRGLDSLQGTYDKVITLSYRQLVNQDLMSELSIFFPDIDTVKVTDYRKFRLPDLIITAAQEEDSVRATLPQLYLQQQKSFPFIDLVCELPESDSLKAIRDSLRNILEQAHVVVVRPSFPYLEIKPSPRVQAQDSTASEENSSQENEDNQTGEPPKSIPPKEADVEVILYWKKQITKRDVPDEEMLKIEEYLRLKLINEDDSMRIIHYGPLVR